MGWWSIHIYGSLLEPAEISGVALLSLLHTAFSNIHLWILYVLFPSLQVERLRSRNVVPSADMPFTQISFFSFSQL